MMLYVGLTAAPAADDEQTGRYNQQWGEYMQELVNVGALEAGSPFAASGQIVSRDSVSAMDLATVDIGGFALIKAESMDAAVQIAERAPHIALGGTTIIRPCVAPGA